MDRQSRVQEFITILETLSSNIITEPYKISEEHLKKLENDIIHYINENYPSIIFTEEEKHELATAIETVYQDRHLNLKNQIDKNIGSMKYSLEDENADVVKIIEEEISKCKTLFDSVRRGTNFSYLGLVDKCTQNVMRLLIRKNTSISFAKRTGEVSKYVYDLINTSFFKIMDEMGNYFIHNEIIPIKEEFKLENIDKKK
ncbi:MAG: hypothetical protein E7165_01450 [Firmicutes bacterium]|nr:hypothetical protein [Bacillota bacterium]